MNTSADNIKRMLKRRGFLWLFMIGVGVGMNLSDEARAAASFQGLGDLSGGTVSSGAAAVSGDGLVVVGTSNSASGNEAFRWTTTDGMLALGDLPGGGFLSEAKDVSADGSVIVGAGWSDSGHEAFRWAEGSGMSGLGDLPGGTFNSVANGISADGSVVVGTGYSEVEHEAFRWTAGDGMVGLGFLPFLNLPPDPVNFSGAKGISADGSVVAGSCNTTPNYEFGIVACRWTESTGMISLGMLSNDAHSPSSGASAVSADGSVIIGTSSSDGGGPPVGESFIWTTDGGLVGLGFLPGTTYGYTNYANAVSADGSVIVGRSDTDTPAGYQAYLWTANDGIRLLEDILTTDLGLNLTGWTLESATGISDDGLTIVGTGINPNGDTEAFIATLPEPGALAVIVLGLPAMLRRRR